MLHLSPYAVYLVYLVKSLAMLANMRWQIPSDKIHPVEVCVAQICTS
jgi:hypothetical protein